MKKVLSIILPLITIAVSINAQPPVSKAVWQQFVAEKENFKVVLPKQPIESIETVETEIGRVPIRTFVSSSAPNHFTVMVAEYPMSFDTDDESKGVIEAGISAMANKLKLENLVQKDISFDKYSGREARAKTSSGVMTIRAYVAKNRLYLLFALTDNASLKAPISSEAMRFLDSFGFVKSPETIAMTAAPVSAIESQDSEPPASFYTQPISWRDFSQTDYGFTVRLPGEPHKETVKINPNDSRLDMHNWIAIGENGLVYQVAFQQLLAVPENDYNANIYIESLRDGLAEGIEGKVVSERRITLNGHPGREFKIKSAKMRALGRLFLVGSRVYILNLMTANGEVNQSAANDYFDSLKITAMPNSVSTTAGTVVETAIWKQVVEPTLGFSVMMPAEPNKEDKRVSDLSVKILAAKGDGVLCLASHMFVPGRQPSPKELSQFFKNFSGGFANGMKAKIADEKEISYGNFPGREYILKTDLVTGKCRVYMVDGHAYLLMSLPTLADNADKAMNKFFDSFKLIERTQDHNDAPPPPPPPPPKPEADQSPAPKKINVSGGVLQASALRKVQPSYPDEAKKQRVQGEVQVQILVSVEGKVIEAQLVSGPAELREAALNAARKWEFKPTELSGVPVKVQGILTFRFTLQ